MAKRRIRRHSGKAVPWVALAIATFSLFADLLQWRDTRAEKARRLDVSLSLGAVLRGGTVVRADCN
jgi:hypothetical protein